MSNTETIRIHECYFIDFCLEFQSKLLDGWRITDIDERYACYRPGHYICNMSREIPQVEENNAPEQPEKPVKPVGRPKQGK